MKERTLIFLFVLLCILFLAGCRAGNIAKFDVDDFSKAQKIVVRDAAGREKDVLTEEEDIDGFVEAMDLEDWRLAELPGDPTRAGSFTLYQEETAKAFSEKDPEMWEICTFQYYEDGDYLAIDTGLADISITFSIPRSAAEYLRSLL